MIFRNRPIRNKNCLWRQCLLTDRDEKSNLYREPSINASFQVSVYLAKRFQSRKFLEIDQPKRKKKELPMVPCLITHREEMWNLYRGPLPGFGSFGQAVSEGKDWNLQSELTTATKRWQKFTWPLTRWPTNEQSRDLKY